MEFDNFVTVAALAAGPAGIWFGWWLNSRGAEERDRKADEQASDAAERERVLALVRTAYQRANETRSVAQGTYLKVTSRREPVGFAEGVASYNAAKDAFRHQLLVMRVLGPSWVVGAAEDVDLYGTRLIETISRLQDGATEDLMKSVNSDIPEMARATDRLVAILGRRYNTTAGELPPRPDYDAMPGFGS